ncbi:hypothetical protein P3T36_001529 [Kitasatospora sp. MAP12-15]|uniref:hypothetical protein n=1 Tax=unclassified Kitasatospora TaxID=2633591 RepID=UPI0024766C36|nr:hypothetical protein [Kitasatospora sp. MAP12-44]MDH6112648.1 hypothetical protein [Kitasatospora sp. MAP12-44]
MSLPLTRRIAQAALLVAAGATPLLAGGVASAADLVPQHTDLTSGVSKLDGLTSDSNVKTETHQVGQALGKTGALAVGTAVPAAADVTGTAATTALPQSDKTLGDLGPQSNATSNATGAAALLASPATGLAKVAPTLAGLLAGTGGAQRAMPVGLPNSAPALPTVSGVDKVVNADTVSNPLGTAGHLTDSIPATSSLSHSLPTRSLPTDALPTADRLGSALPATSLPSTDNLLGQLPAAGQLTHGLPAAQSLHLDQLNGQPSDSAQRLGALPPLGAGNGTDPVSALLGGLTGSLQHPPAVS